ncbi:hypothetical protein [Agromyces larvae]|uniref:DUF2975 domain-containing protein n=1 Tax=Agromyces larvae TaxID=2929802 RepID=A0ABY4BU40_9MICO|nr:hypothetical protein [Agromyces larvae]UOE42694.1 hypothetical protein MTO99_10860 [Agromyces larvae]
MATTTTRRALGLAEKTILGLIAGGAAAIGAVTVVLVALQLAELAGGAETTLFDVVLVEPVPVDVDSPAVVAATSDTATVTVQGLPATARAALMAAAVAGSLVSIGICAVLTWLCVRVFVGKPFVRSATWGIGIVAVLVIVSALAGPLFTGIAHAEAADTLGLDGVAAFMVVFDVAPVGWAFALVVVASAFEIGQRLQHETEGLV